MQIPKCSAAVWSCQVTVVTVHMVSLVSGYMPSAQQLLLYSLELLIQRAPQHGPPPSHCLPMPGPDHTAHCAPVKDLGAINPSMAATYTS